MLAESQPQLVGEPQERIGHLKTYIENINGLRNDLYRWAANKSDHDTLVQVERYHNQLHIQLKNLHDLKHSFKQFMNESKFMPGTDHSEKQHELEEDYSFLMRELDQLKTDFTAFIRE